MWKLRSSMAQIGNITQSDCTAMGQCWNSGNTQSSPNRTPQLYQDLPVHQAVYVTNVTNRNVHGLACPVVLLGHQFRFCWFERRLVNATRCHSGSLEVCVVIVQFDEGDLHMLWIRMLIPVGL